MQSERRTERNRIQSTRTLELVGDDRQVYTGQTGNLSDGGIGAHFDAVPNRGANVLVRLYWDEGVAPVEQRGQVVWSTTSLGCKGLDVGIRICEGDEESTSPRATAQEILPPVVHSEGSELQLSIGGVVQGVTLCEVGAPGPDGRMHITARISSSMAVAGDEEDMEEEDWTPHPFRDVWRTTRRTAGTLAGVARHCAARCSSMFPTANSKS